MINYAALTQEINTDPLGLGYAALISKGSDTGIAQLLNTQSAAYSVSVPVSIASCLKWGATGPLAAIQQAAGNNASQVQSACIAALQLLGSPAVSGLDLTDPAINGQSGLLQAMQTAAVITQAQLTALLALGSRSPASRAEVLFGANVTIIDAQVSHALGRGPAV